MLRKCFFFTLYIRQKELKILNEKADFTQSTWQLLRNCFNFLGEQRVSTCQSWPNITSQSHRLTSFCRSTFLQMGRLDYMSGESSEEKPQTKRSLIGSLLSQLMRYTSTQFFANKRSVKLSDGFHIFLDPSTIDRVCVQQCYPSSPDPPEYPVCSFLLSKC